MRDDDTDKRENKGAEAGRLRERRDFIQGAATGVLSALTLATVQSSRADVVQQRDVTPSPRAIAAEEGPESLRPPRIIEDPTSDFMVDVLKHLNLDYVATNPGSSFKSLHESLVNYGGNRAPEMLTCLHEESAVGMAHGYAKIAGKPMMVLLHGTVGLLHGSMAIYNAFADRVPIYIVAANHDDPSFRINRYHSAQDLGALVRDYVKWDFNIRSLERFAGHAMQAYAQAVMPPRAPVLLSIEQRIQEDSLSSHPPLTIPQLADLAPARGDSGAVDAAADLLVNAERPLIMTERYARTQNGIELLVQLAERLQAPVSGSERLDFPRTHPLYGNGGKDYAADVVLGLEVNDMADAGHFADRPRARVIDISSTQLAHKTNILDFGRYSGADISIAADAEATLPDLIRAVEKRLTERHRKLISARGERVHKVHRQQYDETLDSARHGWNASPISTARLSAELWNQIQNDDWSLVSWQGFISNWPGRLWAMERQYHYIGGHGAAGMGYNAQAAVGAALANKQYGRLSVNIQGDGDLNYAPGILWTAVHHRIPLLTVMHNNRAYHAEVMYLQQECSIHNRGHANAHVGTTITDPNIDYATMARAYGMYAEGPISRPDDLGPALRRALERVRAGEPALVDVVMQPR